MCVFVCNCLATKVFYRQITGYRLSVGSLMMKGDHGQTNQ